MKVIVRRKKCPKIHLAVNGNTLLVDAPNNASLQSITNAIVVNKLWISANMDTVSTTPIDIIPPTRKDLSEVPTTDTVSPAVLNRLFQGKCMMIGGNIYEVVCSDQHKTLLNDCLNVHFSKYQSVATRLKAIKAYVKQYADSNLRAKIAKMGSRLSYCPTNIKLTNTDDVQWWCRSKMLATGSIIVDYRTIQLPYVCQDRIIEKCYALLMNNNIKKNNIDTLCQQYLFVKKVLL